MTLIANFVSQPMVIQASDRLVSRGGSQWDPDSSKTLLVWAENGVAAVGYTGLAYVERIPTDEWLATRIAGIDHETPPPPSPVHTGRGGSLTATRLGPLPGVLRLGPMILRLRRELELLADARGPAANTAIPPPTVSMAGFAFPLGPIGHAEPFFWAIDWQPVSQRYRLAHLSRPLGSRSYVCIVPDLSTFSPKEKQAWTDSILAHISDPAAAEAAAVDVVRQAATRSPRTIGQHVSTIRIVPGTGELHIGFHPVITKTRSYWTLDAVEEVNAVSMTPWLISPNLVQPPQAMFGVSSQALDPASGIEVTFDAPAGTGRIIASSRALDRRPGPRL